MPLFGKKNKDKTPAGGFENQTSTPEPRPTDPTPDSNGTAKAPQKSPAQTPQPAAPPRPKLVFHCQQAHGSPTGIISGFTNVKELYQKIAECYDIESQEVSFTCCHVNCTLIDRFVCHVNIVL